MRWSGRTRRVRNFQSQQLHITPHMICGVGVQMLCISALCRIVHWVLHVSLHVMLSVCMHQQGCRSRYSLLESSARTNYHTHAPVSVEGLNGWPVCEGERRITVVRSPKSGVNFFSLGDFDLQFEAAYERAMPAMRQVSRPCLSSEVFRRRLPHEVCRTASHPAAASQA